jgi:8-oxo-dGTP pyrophosphatase MutT (NUDIX family)
MTQVLKKQATLVFLIRQEGNGDREVCLAMKKRGLGEGLYNGTGGKVEPGETIVHAACREAQEEINVSINPQNLEKVAELHFRFEVEPQWDQVGNVFICKDWQGEPAESEEMKPEWFSIKDIPFERMWASDRVWLPRVLAGENVHGVLLLGEANTVTSIDLETVQDFDK